MAAESGFPAAPRKTLSLFDACALIVGIMLGAGVFRAPAILLALGIPLMLASRRTVSAAAA
jgi:hypothetical protein